MVVETMTGRRSIGRSCCSARCDSRGSILGSKARSKLTTTLIFAGVLVATMLQLKAIISMDTTDWSHTIIATLPLQDSDNGSILKNATTAIAMESTHQRQQQQQQTQQEQEQKQQLIHEYRTTTEWRIVANHADDEKQHNAVLVLVTHPLGTTYEALNGTVRDALLSPRSVSKVLVYASSVEAFLRLGREFASEVQKGHLIVHLTETLLANTSTMLSPDLQDDMNMAYLLDLAAQHQVEFNFTMVLRGGVRLNNNQGDRISPDYATRAVEHYRSLQAARTQINDLNRTCLTKLSTGAGGPNAAFFFETAEHAARMAIALRSVLPYHRRSAHQILYHHCRNFLWEAKIIIGPELFSHETKPPGDRAALAMKGSPFVNASEFRLPPWIDPTVPVGPRIYDDSLPYQIAFGVNTMERPLVGNEYLVQFMEELLQIVESSFKLAPSNATAAERYRAIIVLLISGDSVEQIASHRAFLEANYTDSIDRGIVRLVDAPWQSHASKLQNFRQTFPAERPLRRYWRTKQNLDVAAVLQATAGLSDYVMLIEDDTGFQPGFGTALQDTMAIFSANSNPLQSVAEFGFGYSGVLIRASDLRVFQQLHFTFFDERPCDNLNIPMLVRGGGKRAIQSRTKFANKKRSYFKHYGKQSSLEGKEQTVW